MFNKVLECNVIWLFLSVLTLQCTFVLLASEGEENRPDFPGLTRGLVAVLLYYDGRRSLVTALRTLILALEGPTWTLSLSPDLTHLTNTYVKNLVNENLTNKILGMITIDFRSLSCLFVLNWSYFV